MTSDQIQPGEWRWLKPHDPTSSEDWIPVLVRRVSMSAATVETDGCQVLTVRATRVGELCDEIEFLPATWSAMRERANRVRGRVICNRG